MEFIINNLQESIHGLMRKIGYTPAYFQSEGEFSMVRKLSRQDYPRLHLYVKIRDEKDFTFSLHLDQKKPSYEGSTKHSGEYEGEVVGGEAGRIKDLLM